MSTVCLLSVMLCQSCDFELSEDVEGTFISELHLMLVTVLFPYVHAGGMRQ